jgi:hypothetical protein
MKKQDKEQIPMLSKSQILEMGWTQAMIKKLLPEPTLRPNPIYRSASPMKLWEEKVVLECMGTEEFRAEAEKAEKRKAAVEKGRKTRIKHSQEYLEKICRDISVEVIPDEELRRRTIRAGQDWHEMNDERGDYAEENYHDVDEGTMSRWVVNFILHNLVGYDEALEGFKGKITVDVMIYRNAVLAAIAKAYPKYKEECFLQIAHTAELAETRAAGKGGI